MPMSSVVQPRHVPPEKRRGLRREDDASEASSDYEAIRKQGYPRLRFPHAQEAPYLADVAAEHTRMLKLGGWLLLAVSFIMLAIDACMVPDQLQLALQLRLVVVMPLVLAFLWAHARLTETTREWAFTGLMALAALVHVVLVVRSHDPLAPLYLAGLVVNVLLSGSLVRVRFWHLLMTSLLCVVLYAVAGCLQEDPPVNVLVSLGLAVLVTVVFTLWGAYRLEYKQRDNWLMTQHERELQSRLESGIQQLDELSRFDALTGLPNRRELYQHLNKVWTRARHDGQSVAVLLMDVDHFKAYNDTHGHVQGDECLRQVAHAIRDAVGHAQGLAARWGGEEFVVVLSGADTGQASEEAQRIVDAMHVLKVPHAASPTAPWVTCSVGVAAVNAHANGASPDALMAAADAALYQAKEQGRSRWVAHGAGQALPTVVPVAPLEQPVTDTPDIPNESSTFESELAQLERPLSWLQFRPALEQRYQRDTAPDRLHDFLVTGVLALVMFNVFLVADYLLVHDVWAQAVWLRLGVFTPVCALFITLLWLSKTWVLKWMPPWVHDGVVTLSGVLAGACLTYILSISQSPLAKYYHMGLMVVIIYGNLVQPLRFWYALCHGLAIFALHIYGVFTAHDMALRLLVPMAVMVAAAGLYTLAGNYLLDRDDRINYLLALRRNALRARLQDVFHRLNNLARVDPLTGLFNRRHVNEYLDQAWMRAIRHQQSLAVVMVDIDHFKAYNDKHGHPAGDRCIYQVARALSDSVRGPVDVVGRYGGEEFIAILTQADHQAAMQVAERMRSAVTQLYMPHGASSASPSVSISVGVACMDLHTDLSVGHVLQRADQALYRAKHEGRNRVVTQPALA